jgi:hypothetical protein
MYWPIGAPRIYAASKNELDLNPAHTTISNDGLEAQDPIQTPVAKTEANGTATHDQGGDDDDEESLDNENINGDASSASATDSGGKLPVLEALKDSGASPQRNNNDDDPGGEIVGLKVTRSGHIFATITQATLTVWQTKVAITTPTILLSANSPSSPLLP